MDKEECQATRNEMMKTVGITLAFLLIIRFVNQTFPDFVNGGVALITLIGAAVCLLLLLLLVSTSFLERS